VTITRQHALELKRVWDDTDEFIRRLVILNVSNQKQRINRYFYEQLAYLDALQKFRLVVAVKPRQVGFTTLALAYFFAKTFRSRHPRRVLTTVQDDETMERAADIVRLFHRGLPPEFREWVDRRRGRRTDLKRDSKKVTQFGHNEGVMARLKAGSRNQGRGGTLNDWHGTETAFYPESSSALPVKDDGQDQNGEQNDASTDLLASIDASIHDPEGQIVFESTGNGPSGMFYKVARLMLASGAGGFVFIPWFKVDRYKFDGQDGRPAMPPGFATELREDELALIKDYAAQGLTLEHLAWRRDKLTGPKAMTLLRFRREYPSHPMEPFLFESAGWFSADALTKMAEESASWAVQLFGRADALLNMKDELRIFIQPEAGRAYFLGMDTSGGVGKDEACIVVFRDDLVEVACWQSKWAEVPEQADMLAKVWGLYRMFGGKVVALVENNKYGKEVIERAGRLGVRLWKDAEGNDFNTTGRTAGDSKRSLMVHCQEQVNGGHCVWNDQMALLQAQNIVEKHSGRIENRVRDNRRKSVLDHDDRVMARALGLWCARGHVLRQRRIDPAAELQRQRREFAEKRGRRLPT
jgi:hypothetical protein